MSSRKAQVKYPPRTITVTKIAAKIIALPVLTQKDLFFSKPLLLSSVPLGIFLEGFDQFLLIKIRPRNIRKVELRISQLPHQKIG